MGIESPGVDRRQFLNLAAAATAGVGVIADTGEVRAATPGPWQEDGAGLARIGLLTPSFDFNPESEMWAIAPKGVALFASRMDRGTMPFAAYLSDPSHADAALAMLTALKLRAILYAYSTTSYVLGLDGEETFRARLVKGAQEVPVVLAASALCDAVRALGARRLSVVHPPWFPEEQSEKGRAYYSSRGFEVVSCARIAPERKFTEVAAQEVHDWIAAHASPKADVIVVGGNGLRAVGAIEKLEATLGRPVITANQALLWQGMRTAGVPARAERYGRLFKLDAARP